MSNPNYIIVPAGRWTGATTRTIDAAIQALFEGKVLFFPTKQYIERLEKDGYRGRKATLFNGWEEECKQTPIIDLDWKTGESQDQMIRRFLKRLEFEHDMTLQTKKRDNGYTFSLGDFKKGNRSAVIRTERTEIWTSGLLDKEGRFVMTTPNLDHPNPETFLFPTRAQAEEHEKTKPKDHGIRYRVYLYAAVGDRTRHLGVRRISPYGDIKDAVAEIKAREANES